MAIIPRGTAPETYSYGPHILQRVLVYHVQPQEPDSSSPNSDDRYWVIYVHGGAWRDPLVLANSFDLTETFLRDSGGHPQYASITRNHVAGFASIDYRLSAHPNYPQDPATEASQLRDAKHPDHLHDVQAGLALLQERYGFGDRYILVGHSCGATLIYQIVMGKVAGAKATKVTTPKTVVGVCGIYDCRRLRNDYKNVPIYHQFFRGSFGPDEDLWDCVSPARVSGRDGIEGGWPNGKLAVLASSTGDTVINVPQLLVMKDALTSWKEAPAKDSATGRKLVLIRDLQEEHDNVWGNGEELARVIVITLQELVKMETKND